MSESRQPGAVSTSHPIGGSIARSFAGKAGSAIDIDIAASLSLDQVSTLAAALSHLYLDDDARRRAAHGILGFVRVQRTRPARGLQVHAAVRGVPDLLTGALPHGATG